MWAVNILFKKKIVLEKYPEAEAFLNLIGSFLICEKQLKIILKICHGSHSFKKLIAYAYISLVLVPVTKAPRW